MAKSGYILKHDTKDSALEWFAAGDYKKNYYYRGLSEWKNEKGWLTDTCPDGQDTFMRLLYMLEIQY